MANVLTRIKNNQITDSTILANTKIVPGSIVGSLFNANLTMSSDVTITGNLTVQGSSTYLTVASTNTYVNDPLILLNNAFTGTNTYDIGLLINRGNQTTTAFTWNEAAKEFQTTYTTDDGTTYGTINNSGFANLKVGNLTANGSASFGSISTTGDLGAVNLTLSGDAAVNGGDLTTTATTFNLLNSTATTINFGSAATALSIGSASGTANINNATTNILGNADVGGTLSVTGHVTIEGVTSTGATGSGNLVFGNSPALTTPNIGTPSFANLSNATELPVSTGISGLATGVADFLTTPSSANLITVVTDETGTGNLVFSDSPVLVTPNIGTPSFANLSNATELPVSTGISGLGANIAAFLATPSSSNLIDAITDETGSGSLVFATSPTLNNSIIAGSSSFDLLNTNADTIYAFGAATTLELGATSGNTSINNNLNVGLTLSARDINDTVIGNVTPASGKFTSVTDESLTATRVTYAGTGGDLTDSSNFTYDAGILTVQNFSINGTTAEISVIGGSGNIVLNPDAGGVIDATGSLLSNIADPVSAQDAVSLNYLQTQINSGVTNIQSDDTDVTIHDTGLSDGSITSNVDGVSVYTLTASSASYFGGFVVLDETNSNVEINGTAYIDNSLTVNSSATIADTVTINATSGNGLVIGDSSVSFGKELVVGGNVKITANTEAVDTTTGALTVVGGLGVGGYAYFGGNVSIEGNLHVTGTQTVFNSNTVVISDPLIYLGDDNPGDVLDLGIVSSFTDTHYQHTGFVRDANDSIWKLFANVVPEPTTTVDFTDATYSTMMLGNIIVLNDANIANVLHLSSGVASTNSTTGALVIDDQGGAGIGGNLYVAGDIGTDSSSINLVNTSAITVNLAGAATTLTLGSTSGNINLRNENIWLPNATSIDGAQAEVSLLTQATTVNAFLGASELVLGSTTGVANIRNATTNILGNATVTGFLTASTSNADIASLQYRGSKIQGGNYGGNQLELPVGFGATLRALYEGGVTLESGTTGTASATWNFAANGVATIPGDIVTSATTANVLDTTATTVNAFGAASALTIGATTGTTTIRNATTAITGNLAITGNIDVTGPATFSSVTDESLTATRVTFAGTGGDLTDSSDFTYDAGILTVQNFSINGATAEISVIGGSGNVILNPDSGGVIDATGSIIANVANPVNSQDVVTLDYLNTTLSANVASIHQNNTDVTVTDSGTGHITANVDGLNAFEFGASSASFLSSFVTFNTIYSNVSIDGNIITNGAATINSTVESTGTTVGALTVAGGVGIAETLYVGGNVKVPTGNLNIGLNQLITIGLEAEGNVAFPETPVEIITDANTVTPVVVRNRSTGNSAVTSFIALADNGDIEMGLASFGIAGSGYNTATLVKPNDSFLYALPGPGITGGNLVVGVVESRSIIFEVGDSVEANIVAKVNYTNFEVAVDTISSSTTSGALIVAGGVGIGGATWIANGAVINDSQTSENFTVKGASSTTLIYADSDSDAVIIGGSNASPQLGATLKINSTDTMLLPIGSTAQRPSNTGNVDVAGMIRFNNSINNMEFFDGTVWQVTGSLFTVITDRQFATASGNPYGNVDGTNYTFTIQADSTTASTLVSINGVLQMPALAYSVTGSTLTFTEAPEVGDIIDVRLLTTTATVTQLLSDNGYNSVSADLDGVSIWTGSGSPVKRINVDQDGVINLTSTKTSYNQTATSVNTSAVVIDSFAKATYRSAKYLIEISNSGTGEYETREVLVVHNGTTAYETVYGVLYTGSAALGTTSVAINGSNVELSFTGAVSGNAVKVMATYIKA